MLIGHYETFIGSTDALVVSLYSMNVLYESTSLGSWVVLFIICVQFQ
jgi:hypothetical protein